MYQTPITKHIGTRKVLDRVIGAIEHDQIMRDLTRKLPCRSRRLDIFTRLVDEFLDAEYVRENTTIRQPVIIKRGTRLCEEHERGVWINRDLPDHVAFVEQGRQEAINPHIDLRIEDAATGLREVVPTNPDYYRFHWKSGAYDADETRIAHRVRRRMDAGHFRELCYQSKGRNQALYMRQKVDFDTAQHLRPEWLCEKIDIDWADALSLCEFMRRMRFTRPMALKFIFGYTEPGGSHKGGLKALARAQITAWAARFAQLAEDLPELPEDESMLEHSLEESRKFYFDESSQMDFETPFEQADWIESRAAGAHAVNNLAAHHGDIERLIELGFNVEKPAPTAEDERCEQLMQTVRYLPFDSNPYSSHGLFYGDDAIGWDLVVEIKEADMNQLKEIQNRMFPQRSYRSWEPAEYRHFTYGQRTSFWAYMNARKQELAAAYRQKLSLAGQQLIVEIKKLGAKPATKALIMAYKNGGSFESDTHYFEFAASPPPSAEEMYVIWGVYREMAA